MPRITDPLVKQLYDLRKAKETVVGRLERKITPLLRRQVVPPWLDMYVTYGHLQLYIFASSLHCISHWHRPIFGFGMTGPDPEEHGLGAIVLRQGFQIHPLDQMPIEELLAILLRLHDRIPAELTYYQC